MIMTTGLGRRAHLTRNVAPGIHRLAHAYVNLYLVEEGSAVTIVDAGFPATWRHVRTALGAIGRTTDDVEALVITHAHFDHVGFAARAQRELRLPVFVHEQDRYIAAHPYQYAHERPRLTYPLRYPGSWPILRSMTRAGALMVKGVTEVANLPDAGVLDVPGRPTVVFTPGHTYGHCALHFPERDAVLTGDALVTLDPYTGDRGARMVARAATADSSLNLVSLGALAATEASIVLTGHGEPWRDGIASAVAEASARGAA